MTTQYSPNKNTTSNDITGDKIQTRGTLSVQGRKNFDNIDWGKKARMKADHPETLVINTIPVTHFRGIPIKDTEDE